MPTDPLPNSLPPLPAGAKPLSGSGDASIQSMISSAASMAGIPVDIATRLVKQESGFNPRAYNPSGAAGLTQLMPGTAKELGVSDVYNPAENLAGGFKYLAQMKRQFGSWDRALAAYNWGPGNVQDWIKRGANFADLPAETRNYVRVIAPDHVAVEPVKKKSLLQLTSDVSPPLPKGAVPIKRTQEAVDVAPSRTDPPLPAGARPLGRVASSTPTTGPLHLQPSLLSQFAQNLEQRGQHGIAHVLRTAADAADDPTSILNAVLGAPQRFVAGNEGIGGGLQGFIPPWMNPKAIAGGIYGVFHPNDPNVEQKFEDAIGVSKLKVKNPQTLGGKIRNAAVDVGAQTVSDPLTFLGAAGATRALGDDALARLGRAGDAALTSQNPSIRKTAAFVIPNPLDRVALTPRGQAAVRGIRNAESLRAQRQAAADEQLLTKYKSQIASGNVPEQLRQRLLREPFLYGTQEMRDQAISMGYKPTAADLNTAPAGILNYDLREDYFPHLGQHTMPEQLRVIGRQYDVPEPRAGFEKHQEGNAPLDPLGSMTYRLAAGRAAVKHRMMQARMSSELGLPLEDMGKGDESKITANVRDSAKAYDIMSAPEGQRLESPNVIRDFSNIGRDTLIGANPIPHSKNISTLAFLAGGVKGLAKGLQYALSGIPDALAKRLEEHGAGAHFMLSTPSKLSPTKYLPWRKASQAALDRVDMGMRAARLEQLDKQYGNALTDYEKAQKVNEDIGDYRNSPAYVTLAKDFLGAQFPQWHGYIVPTAIARAALRNPERIEGLIRAETAGNQNVLGNEPYTIRMGGPVDEFGTLTQAPGEAAVGKWPSYLISPSMIGPVGSAVSHMSSQAQSFNAPSDSLSQMLIPYYSILAPQFGINPFGSKAPPNVRSIAAFFAAYPKAKESFYEMRIRDVMEQQGKDRFQAQKEVTKELRYLDRLIR